MPDRAFETHLGGALQMMTHAALSKSPRPRSFWTHGNTVLVIGSVATPLHRLSLCLPNAFALDCIHLASGVTTRNQNKYW
jgi:hypothetical protein